MLFLNQVLILDIHIMNICIRPCNVTLINWFPENPKVFDYENPTSLVFRWKKARPWWYKIGMYRALALSSQQRPSVGWLGLVSIDCPESFRPVSALRHSRFFFFNFFLSSQIFKEKNPFSWILFFFTLLSSITCGWKFLGLMISLNKIQGIKFRKRIDLDCILNQCSVSVWMFSKTMGCMARLNDLSPGLEYL